MVENLVPECEADRILEVDLPGVSRKTERSVGGWESR
jgi:hypothetical protein